MQQLNTNAPRKMREHRIDGTRTTQAKVRTRTRREARNLKGQTR